MKEYYYLDANKNRIGPLSIEELAAKNINANTLVWKSGLANWVKASSLPELAPLLMASVPPQTPPNNAQQNMGNAGGYNNGYNNGTNYNNNGTNYNNGGGYYNQNAICPPTNLVWAILSTVLCCLPLGVVAIVKASQVERHFYAGRYEEAKKASDAARNWSIISAVASFIFGILYFFFVIAVSAF